MATTETEEIEREESPDEDFDGRKDEKELDSSSDSDSDDAGSDIEVAERKRKGKEVLDLDEDEAKALVEDLGTDVREGKRIRRNDVKEDEGEKNDNKTKQGPSLQSDEIWKSIQTGKDTKEEPKSSTSQEEMVTILRTYKFAGEEIVKEEKLPASDPFAKQYLAKQAQTQAKAENVLSSIASANSIATSSRPLPPPGPRRKKGGGLAAMSAAATGKPDKLNTLEKSKMDWTKYKDSTLGEQERFEMDAQTKGGSSGLGSMKGYMERRNFLERVQDRLEGQERGGSK